MTNPTPPAEVYESLRAAVLAQRHQVQGHPEKAVKAALAAPSQAVMIQYLLEHATATLGGTGKAGINYLNNMILELESERRKCATAEQVAADE